MDLRQAGYGLALLIVFWAFQVGYFNSLGMTVWLVAVIIFSVVLWLIGKSTMPKQSAEMKELWMFTFAFVLLATVIISYGAGYIVPAFSSSALVSAWLIIFGGAMFITGWQSKRSIAALIGVIWLFSSVITFTSSGGLYSFMMFGLVTGLPFLINGLIKKR